MNLLGRGSSRAEDRFEAWLKQKHQERVLSGQTEPAGPCPNEAYLRGVARRSRFIQLSDPRIDHVADCPNCTTRLKAMRQTIRLQRKKLIFGLSTGFAVVIVGLIAWFGYPGHNQETVATAAPVSRIVDLWNTGTYRGEQPSPLQSVILPSARVRLTIILPRFSSPGQYLVAVTRDQSGNGVVAEGFASAIGSSNGQEKVSMELDLRRARAGAYFLSTTHEQDQAAYYYPLQIK